MIEQDGKDSLPEDALVTWTCPVCGHQAGIMARFLEAAQCPYNLDALVLGVRDEWFDELDSIEPQVA